MNAYLPWYHCGIGHVVDSRKRLVANFFLQHDGNGEVLAQLAVDAVNDNAEAHRLYGCHGETLLNTLHRLRKAAAGFESKSKLFREKLTDCEQALARSEQQALLSTEKLKDYLKLIGPKEKKLKEMRHALELVVAHYDGQVSCFHPAVYYGVDVLETVKKALA